MTQDKQGDSHRRSATRAPIGRPIHLQFDDSMDVIEGRCRNISIGGMFIESDSARPAGSLVRFELELEDNNAIRGLGEVVWMRGKSELGPEPGFGLKFRFLEQQDRQLIFKLVSQHIKQRLSRRDQTPAPLPDLTTSLPGSELSEALQLESQQPESRQPEPQIPEARLSEAPISGAQLAETLGIRPPEVEAAPQAVVTPSLPLADVTEPHAGVVFPSDGPVMPAVSTTVPPPSSEPFSADPQPGSIPSVPAVESAGLPDAPALPEVSEPASNDSSLLPDLAADVDLEPPSPMQEADQARPALATDPSSRDAVLPPAISAAELAQQAQAPTEVSPTPPIAPELKLSSMDLDPAVGDTPLYEVGLDPEPARPSLFEQPSAPVAGDSPAAGWGAGASAERERASRTELPGQAVGSARTEQPIRTDHPLPTDLIGEEAPPRRSFGALPAILILGLAVAAGYYFFGRGGPDGGAGAPVAAETAGSEAAAGESDPMPEVEISTDGATDVAMATRGESEPEPLPVRELAPALPITEPAASPPAEASPPPASSPPAATSPPPSIPAPSSPVPSSPVPSRPLASSPPAERAPAVATTTGDFTQLVDISWSDVSGGSKVVLTGDGPIVTGQYKYFRLDGDAPREVIKLFGARRPFGQTQISVVAPGIRQIRTGYHRKGQGGEVHVVIDLVGPKWKITEVQSLGDRLEIVIGQ